MKQERIRTKYAKKVFLLLAVLSLFILSASAIFAIPQPMGFDGAVYDLDGITRADSKVSVKIVNLNNSFALSGRLRNDGSFSAVIKGEVGDRLILFFWNERSNSTYNLTLEGVTHGHVFYLNLSKEMQDESLPTHRAVRRNKKPKVIFGTIDFSDSPADKIDYVITNKNTGENRTGKTYGFNGYSEVIEGDEGDEIEIKVGNENHNERTGSRITGDVVRTDIDLEVPGWLYRIKQIDIGNLLSYLSLIFIAAIPVFLLFGAVIKKR